MSKSNEKPVRDQNMPPVRLSEAEKASFEQAAEREGRTLSGWVRYILKRAAGKVDKA